MSVSDTTMQPGAPHRSCSNITKSICRRSGNARSNRTPAERVAMVWPLTKTAWTFKEAGERSRDEDGHANEKTKRPVLNSDCSETSSAFARRGS